MHIWTQLQQEKNSSKPQTAKRAPNNLIYNKDTTFHYMYNNQDGKRRYCKSSEVTRGLI